MSHTTPTMAKSAVDVNRENNLDFHEVGNKKKKEEQLHLHFGHLNSGWFWSSS